jgi:four helix bundle protein
MGYRHLRVYQAAVQLRAEIDTLFASIPHRVRVRCANMIKHVDECVDSILNNIAEGNDSVYPNKKAHFFDIAAGSAKEGRNGIESLAERGAFTRKAASKAIGLICVIPKMLRDMRPPPPAQSP